MLRIAETAEFEQAANHVVQRVGQEQLAIRLPENATRARLLARVAKCLPGAVVVRVRVSLDQIERVVLDIATGLAGDVLTEVDEHLRACPDDLTNVLEPLSRALKDRPLLIDGWDQTSGRGADPELGRALDTQREQLRTWLREHGRLFLHEAWAPTADVPRYVPPRPTTLVCLRNGVTIPNDLGDDERNPELFLAAQALGDDETEESPAFGDELRSRISSLLGGQTRDALYAAALHNRPLPIPILDRVLDVELNVEVGERLGLWQATPSGLFTNSGWTDWLARTMGDAAKRRLHRSLAQAFALVAEREVMGLNVLEAHRHFVAAGERHDAERFLRYGAALMVEAARGRSLAGEHDGAVELHRSVLDGAADHRWPVPKRLLGYARHYLHFNRALCRREPLDKTVEGYQQAVADWPGNALFWSRLVRAQCYLGHGDEALKTLETADAKVAEHALKRSFLIARTVRGLLDYEHSSPTASHLVADAVRIWGDYVPDTADAEEIGKRFRRRLRIGWSVKEIALEHDEPLVFSRSVSVAIEEMGGGYLAEFAELEVRSSGATPLAALRAVLHEARKEVAQLVRTYTHELEPSARLRKRMLLGAVDIIASRLDAEAQGDTWVFGELERDDNGVLWLRTGGSAEYWFAVPPELAPDPDHQDSLFFARVDTGSSGEPREPIKELERTLVRDADEVWAQWRKKLAGS